MPKKISLTEIREWLQLYEQGRSEASIAREVHRDVKTIKRGINRARMERDAATARSELLIGALRKHQNSLLEVINRVLSALELPPYNLEIRRESDDSIAPIPLSMAQISYDSMKGLVVKLQDEDTAQWELLREHLSHDRLWNALDQWKTAMTAHIHARIYLKLEAEMRLQGITKLEVIRDINKAPEGGFIYLSAVELLYEVTLKHALGIPDETNPEERIVATSDGHVKHGDTGSYLAYCPGSTGKCKEGIIGSFKDLQNSSKAKEVRSTYQEDQESTVKARRSVEEIALLGLVPGQCRVCHRLGV